LKIAAKMIAESRKFAAAILAANTASGNPEAIVELPARAVTAVESSSETRSKKAAARTNVNENSLLRMNDHTPPGCDGAAQILSSASWSEPTKPAAAKSSTATPTIPAQPSGLAVPAASSICFTASEPVGPITPDNCSVKPLTAMLRSRKSEAMWIEINSRGAIANIA
jgi:hypothetical protein